MFKLIFGGGNEVKRAEHAPRLRGFLAKLFYISVINGVEIQWSFNGLKICG